MMKLATVGVAVLAVGLLLSPARAAAQGRGVGGGAGVSGGPHGSLGAPGAGAGNSHASTHETAGTTGTSSTGPKAPATLLSQNTQLSKNLAALLPAGTNLTTAAEGFKNLGGFVSAVHVSHNLGIPFDQLKCTELGTTKAISLGMTCPKTVTNTSGMSLGKTIQTIKPDANSQEAVQTANQEAKKDMANTKS